MNDIDMLKYLLNKTNNGFVLESQDFRHVRTDLTQQVGPFDIKMIHGNFMRLSWNGDYASGESLFDENGNILELDIYS